MLVYSWTNRYDLVILPHTVRTPVNQLYSHLLPHALLPHYDYTQPIQQAFVRLLKQLGAKEVDTSYEFPLLPQHREYAQHFLQAHNLQPNHFLVINPVGGIAQRSCSLSQVQALIEAFTQAGHKIILLDYQNAFSALQQVCPRSTSPSIFETAALIQQSRAVVTVDTGIVHLADCFHKKMLVLYAADRYSMTNNRTFWASCQTTTQFLQGKDTVKDIPVPDVEKMIKEMLS